MPSLDFHSRYCFVDAAGGVRCLSGEYWNLEAMTFVSNGQIKAIRTYARKYDGAHPIHRSERDSRILPRLFRALRL